MSSIKMKITNVKMGGDYTGTIYVGNQQTPIDVILDTGSSTLAVDGSYYKPGNDSDMQVTNFAQEVEYGTGNWYGAIVNTNIGIEEEGQSLQLKKCNIAVTAEESTGMFGKGSGILGLAYTELNNGYNLEKPTYPDIDINQITPNTPQIDIEPYFTQLEEEGLSPNKFSFYTLRSFTHYGSSDPTQDPLNMGYFILGGGEEYTNLYDGDFMVAKVLDDIYYNTNMKSIRVGNCPPINMAAPKGNNNLTNSIVDSGTNGIYLENKIYLNLMKQFYSLDKEFYQLINQFNNGNSVTISEADLAKWPNIYIVLEGDTGDIKLTLTPATYWQLNSASDGSTFFTLFSQKEQMAILGLPLMNNYFCIFDRTGDQGKGVIKFAPIKK